MPATLPFMCADQKECDMSKDKITKAENLAEAPETDAPETAAESRDERHDSIDPATGALTEEAVALRRDRD